MIYKNILNSGQKHPKDENTNKIGQNNKNDKK